MKKDVSHTSIIAYYDLDLGEKQFQVASAIRDLQGRNIPASCESIADYLGYEKNRVTGRIKELRDKGAINYAGFTKSKYNKNVECYQLVTKNQQGLGL